MGSNLLGSLCFMTLPCGYSYSSSHLAQAQLSVVHIYQKSKISQEIKCQNSLNVYYTVVVHILRGICSIMYWLFSWTVVLPYFLEFFVLGLERYQCDLITHGSTGCWINSTFLVKDLNSFFFLFFSFFFNTRLYSSGLIKAVAHFEERCQLLRPCLVPHLKFFHPSHRIFGHMHRTLNIHKKNKLITQFDWKTWDESFKPS